MRVLYIVNCVTWCIITSFLRTVKSNILARGFAALQLNEMFWQRCICKAIWNLVYQKFPLTWITMGLRCPVRVRYRVLFTEGGGRGGGESTWLWCTVQGCANYYPRVVFGPWQLLCGTSEVFINFWFVLSSVGYSVTEYKISGNQQVTFELSLLLWYRRGIGQSPGVPNRL